MSAPTTTAGAEPMSHRRTLEALSGLLLVLFVAMLSSTVVSTALPKIIGALNGSQTQYTWVVTATLLTATATTPIWGKLADLFSKKALIQLAIVVFLLGSIVAGFAQSAGQLIAARAFQGIGVGGLQALVQVAIAAMIPPRERGRYNGYLGGVMALATVGGPLLGGLIVDTSWLGWRWCFFVGVPVAILALVLLQATLNLPTVRRQNVKIDYLGASLIAAGVSVLLIWISFVDSSFAWVSWETAAMVGGSLVLLALAVWVEARAAEPVVPLSIVRQHTTALAILGSLAVGMAMFGGAVFLGQYFQIGRGYSPTEAGLLTIPMMAGVLLSSIIAGRLITRTGRIKPYIVVGSIVLVAGFALLGTIDHETSLYLVGAAMFIVGTGVGMTMQNLVLAVQNTVALKDIGAASASVAFFRSLGGTIGVSVLGAVLARRVTDQITHDLAAAGVPASGDGSGSSNLNITALPDAVQHIVRAAYGDATGHIFLISAAIAVVGVIAALLLKPVTLRNSLDLPDSARSAAVAADAVDGAPAIDQVNVDTAREGAPTRG
ncbi:MDR family MFS transporter [Micromonospora krabiensis]|uniref:Drug resistance transporter, EmrB/QacA subfamily n=1 Tax=Micromonospora krabiensis TaxID=307121 RepID=A0A1C3N313_9ACTN|nr:MDR family MFS transporter [Micromonospora krabiensis]SBV26946.1 drug resistance transporter, EmrB/QacA subfamily [Micromonospora krabiensis]